MEQTTPPSNPKSSNTFWIWLVVIAIPVGILAYIAMNKETKAPAPEPVAIKNEEQIKTEETPVMSSYKDGIYNVVGDYISPGGAEQIGLSVTLKDGVITETTFESKTERPISIRFQGLFAEGYKEFVVGKKIDEVNLTKVSGSSLTPKGFNDAIEKIKAEAKS